MEHTIIVFASDHQSPKAKMTCYEEAANAPGAIMWRGQISPGKVSDALVSNIDVVPTLLDLAGIDVPADYRTDGKSWRGLLGLDLNESEEATEAIGLSKVSPLLHESLYLEVVYQRAVVTNDWKYVAVRFPDSIQATITPENRNRFTIEGRRGRDRYFNDTIYPAYYADDQLYYLPEDPGEQKNLAGQPEYREQLERMKILLRGYVSGLPFAYGEFQ